MNDIKMLVLERSCWFIKVIKASAADERAQTQSHITVRWLTDSFFADLYNDWPFPLHKHETKPGCHGNRGNVCLKSYSLGGNVFRSTGPVGNPVCVLHQDVHVPVPVPVFVQDILFRLRRQRRVLFYEHHKQNILWISAYSCSVGSL